MKNQTAAAVKAVSDKKVFSYERQMATASTLKIHPCIEAMGLTVPNEIFADFVSEFNFIETPVITEDGFVITHATDVIGAQQLKIENIEVVLMKNATENDVIRFISFKDAVKHGQNKTNLFSTIKFLTSYLTKTEPGIEWGKSLEGSKTRSKVAGILGVSPGTVQSVTVIGNKKPELLAKIDHGEITGIKALEQVNNVIPFESRKRFSGLVISNTQPQEQPKLRLNGFSLNYEELGELNLVLSNEGVSASLNGDSLGKITHSVESDNESQNNERQHTQTHTFQQINDRFSIQIIIRDLDQLTHEGVMKIAA